MKHLIIASVLAFTSFSVFSQSGNLVNSVNCTVPPGWSSCTATCWFSDCCIVFNPRTSEAACSCFFGVARCASGPMGQAFNSNGATGNDATVKFAFDRFSEAISYLRSQKIATASLETALSSFQSHYTLSTSMTLVTVSDYNNFVQQYQQFIDGLTADQKNILAGYIKSKG
ncbi:MAG: hypothetical protein IPP31_08935 [Chitinophagaceae bacterium]|nr:hypothetical protein [Chitinophagaceae bacterium]